MNKQFLFSTKHKDSFSKSERVPFNFFFGEIVVFDHDYTGKPSSSKVWSEVFYFVIIIYSNYISNRLGGGGGPCEPIYSVYRSLVTYKIFFARSNHYQTVNLTSVQSLKVVQKYFE